MTASRFARRVALVTGASSGLGRALALALAREGARVAAVGRDGTALARTVAEIEQDGGRALALAGDVRSDDAVAHAVARVGEELGGLDLVAHAAGVAPIASVAEMTEAAWDEVLDTNLKSCFLLARHAAPAMRSRGGGAVVNVSSIFAHAATPGSGAYAASKAGVEALTRMLALEHAAEGIRFNAVAPGGMRTPMVERDARARAPDDPEAQLAAWGRDQPIGRLVAVDEVVAAVLFLLSDAASGITGTSLVVDGGRLTLPGSADAYLPYELDSQAAGGPRWPC